MSLAIITLPTNKSISTVSDHVRKLGQGEKGQKLSVIVTDANGSGYDLTEKSLTFSENKEGGKIVSDNDSSHFSVTDAKAGRFDYTLAPAVYAASGTAWFDITSADGSVIDTTKNFDIDVIEDEGIHINNDNYVSNLSAFETHYQGVIQKSKQDSEALLAKINSDLSQALADNNKKAADALTDQKAKLQTVIDAATKLESDWQDQFTKQKQSLTDVDTAWQAQTKKIQDAADAQVKNIQDSANAKIQSIQTDYNTQKAKIQSDADQQLKDNQSKADTEIAKLTQQVADNQTASDNAIKKLQSDAQTAINQVTTDKNTAIQAVNDARDKAISNVTSQATAKLVSIQSDYDSWKKTATGDFQSQIDKLGQELKTDEDDQASLETAIDSAKEAVSKIQDVDFTLFAHKSDLQNYYTKTEVDTKLADAGKLKTISINGGTPVSPDETTGNANLTIPQPDLSGLETKTDAKTAHDDLASKISTNATNIKSNADAIATKANASDVPTKAEMQTAIDNGGKVKTVNGNAPDTTGDVKVDLSGLETKSDATAALASKADKTDVTTMNNTLTGLSTQITNNANDIKIIRTKLSDGTLAQVAHFKAADEAKAINWSKDDGKGGLPKFGIIDG